ncbi:MAG: ATP-dependent zinc metalloprotease FtsH [Victivallales bacterium]|nr:ATP-dependent zinc metalloprotease FtsH [Victivallales bacterium]
MLLLYTNRKSGAREVELTSSQFESLLLAKRIAKVVIEERSSIAQDLTGEFWPDGATVGDAKALRPFRVKVLYTDAMDQVIRENCPDRNVKSSTNWFLTLLASPLLFLVLLVLFYWFFFRQLRTSGQGAMQFGRSRARMMQPTEEKITFKDVAGIKEALEEMQEIVDYLKAPDKFSRLGGRIPHGVLMVGPPGTGKTLLAKAIAGEAGVPFFTISGSDFVELFVGVGASRVRDMFAEAKKHSPCLIFIDEIDAVGRSRFAGIGGGNDEREQTLNALLVEMDGFEGNTGVIVIAATNRPDVLDPALKRPGRFDREIVIDLPDMEGRFEILQIHAKKIKLDPTVDLHIIARGTPGCSGAELANLLTEAAILATRTNKEMVGLAELEESRDKVRWGKERRSRKLTERTRRLTAYHEGGHTLVNLYMKHAEPLHKVTIIPRGMAMGATMYLPKNDRYDITENEALDYMVMCMGGRCAEQLVFQEVTSGAAQDIKQATELARRMVCEWGMNPKLGPVSYSGRQEHIYLGRDITRSDDMSPDTQREIDLEIRHLVDAAEEKAKEILTTHRDQLEKLAEALIVQETMTAEQVYALLEMPMPKDASDEEAAESHPEPPPLPTDETAGTHEDGGAQEGEAAPSEGE